MRRLERRRRRRRPAAGCARRRRRAARRRPRRSWPTDAQDRLGRDAEHLLDLVGVAVGVGGRQVDLVEGGDDLEVVLEGQVAVGEGLGLDALGGVDEEHRALAGGQAAAHLVGEVDVAGRVDEVEDVALPVEADRLELDGDAPLPLDVHRVEVLLRACRGGRRRRTARAGGRTASSCRGRCGRRWRGCGGCAVPWGLGQRYRVDLATWRDRHPPVASPGPLEIRGLPTRGEHQEPDQAQQAERRSVTSATRPCARSCAPG